jgi:hypothetical protein
MANVLRQIEVSERTAAEKAQALRSVNRWAVDLVYTASSVYQTRLEVE